MNESILRKVHYEWDRLKFKWGRDPNLNGTATKQEPSQLNFDFELF